MDRPAFVPVQVELVPEPRLLTFALGGNKAWMGGCQFLDGLQWRGDFLGLDEVHDGRF